MGRMERINQLMKREIAKIVQMDLQDPRFQFVSITKVKVSPDLKNSWVSFSFLGDKEQAENVQGALKHAAGAVRRLVSQRIELRQIPRIEFIYDPSLDYSANVEETLEIIKREIPFEEDVIDDENDVDVDEEDGL